MRPWILHVLGLAALCLAFAAPTQAHGVFEAQELEIHAINDEGSDAIELYGGYDITEVFVGSAYHEGYGDAVYVRLELYGLIEQQTALMPWSVRVSYETPNGPGEHTLSTTDGQTFTHDFVALQSEFDEAEHAVSIERAILSSGNPLPGEPLLNLHVESFWGNDLRDVAPGGIPAPGLGGAIEYPEPTAIEGQGRLVETPVPPTTDAYFGTPAATRDDATQPLYNLNVPNGLRNGGQHMRLVPATNPAWTLRLDTGEAVVAANGTAHFVFEARASAPDAAPLALEVRSDVGGRLVLLLQADGSLADGDQNLIGPLAAPIRESPSLGLPLMLVALACLVVVRRWT